MFEKLIWKTVRETDKFQYQQHRLTRSRRAKPAAGTVKGIPYHQEWLRGGAFKDRKKAA
jgi:hypothetical protein